MLRQRSHLHKALGPDDARTEAVLSAAIAAALEGIAASLAGDRALRALRRNDVQALLGSLDWESMSFDLGEGVQDVLAGVHLSKGWRAMFDVAPAAAYLDFGMLERRAIDWAVRESGKLVVAVSNDVRAVIRQAVTGGLLGQQDIYATARIIREVVPLTPRWARATANTYQRTFEAAMANGSTAAAADKAATAAMERQAKRLLRVRSQNIARTETMTASNQGRLSGWTVEIEQGRADPDSRKEWTVGDEACPICDPMNGEVVRWDAPFSSGSYMPPEHPSCRCTAVLLPPDAALRGPATKARVVSDPDEPRRERPKGGELTNEGGKIIAESARKLARGRITAEQHQEVVRRTLGVTEEAA